MFAWRKNIIYILYIHHKYNLYFVDTPRIFIIARLYHRNIGSNISNISMAWIFISA